MESVAEALPENTPERRNFHRVTVKMYGRYMLEDRTEHSCAIVDMSPGSVSVRADRIPAPGERIVAYIDHIGRIEGVTTRTFGDGFAFHVIASERKRDKIAAQLTWLANKHELNLPEDRRHERLMPRNPRTILHMPDKRQYTCRIIDLSLSGAAVELDVRPAIGTQVTLGNMRGQIVRHFDEGIAIEFGAVQHSEQLASMVSGPAN